MPGRSLFPTGKLTTVSQIAVFTPPFLQTQYHWQSGLYLGVAFQRVLIRYRTESGTGLRHLPADGGGEPWKVEEATQILHINHGEMQITSSPKKFSGYFHFYRKHKDKFDRASKKYQLFTLYQIRNKRMTWRTLLTLLSVRNGKRLADGIRGR